MKYTIVLLYLLSFSFTLYSQKISSSLSLQAGIAIPVQNFSSTDLNKGSFTLAGFSGSAEVQFKCKSDLGAFIQSGYQINPINVSELGLQKVKADPFLNDLYIRSEPFRYLHVLAGPDYTFQINNSLSLRGQIAGGIFVSHTPYQLYKPDYFMTGPPYYEITSSRDVSFAYGLGLHLNYQVNSCYSIGIYSQYISSSASFEFQTGSSIRTDKRNISSWNSSLCLAINLF